MSTDLKDRLEIIDQLIEKKPLYKEVLAAYREMIICIHDDSRVADSCVTRDPPEEVRAGQSPLFKAHKLPIDFAAAGAVLSKLVRLRLRRQGLQIPGVTAASDEAINDPAWTRAIFEAILTRNHSALASMGENAGLAPAGLRFLAIAALGSWMAALRDRFVGKMDLESEQELVYRVYACQKCQRYLKTVDKRGSADEIPMDLEYLVTLHLDLLAAENGLIPMAYSGKSADRIL